MAGLRSTADDTAVAGQTSCVRGRNPDCIERVDAVYPSVSDDVQQKLHTGSTGATSTFLSSSSSSFICTVCTNEQ